MMFIASGPATARLSHPKDPLQAPHSWHECGPVCSPGTQWFRHAGREAPDLHRRLSPLRPFPHRPRAKISRARPGKPVRGFLLDAAKLRLAFFAKAPWPWLQDCRETRSPFHFDHVDTGLRSRLWPMGQVGVPCLLHTPRVSSMHLSVSPSYPARGPEVKLNV